MVSSSSGRAGSLAPAAAVDILFDPKPETDAARARFGPHERQGMPVTGVS